MRLVCVRWFDRGWLGTRLCYEVQEEVRACWHLQQVCGTRPDSARATDAVLMDVKLGW